MEFSIDDIVRHEKGYFVATITDYSTQKVYILHNKWGSWRVGEAGAVSGYAPETISTNLAFVLQDRIKMMEKELEKAATVASNPFLDAKPVVNPFMTGAAI